MLTCASLSYTPFDANLQALVTVHKDRFEGALGTSIVDSLPPPIIRPIMQPRDEIFIRQLKGSYIGRRAFPRPWINTRRHAHDPQNKTPLFREKSKAVHSFKIYDPLTTPRS